MFSEVASYQNYSIGLNICNRLVRNAESPSLEVIKRPVDVVLSHIV